MLDLVRNLVSSIFGKILLAVMVLSFALWGVGDILTSGNSQLAAKIGNEKITLDEFYNEFQNTLREYNRDTQSNISLKDAYEMQFHNQILNDLLYSKMINDYAKSKNIYLSNNSLKIFVKDLPQFQNNDGKFSNTKYKNFIISNFPNEEIFLKQVENIVFQGLIFENFSINNYMKKSIVDLLFNFEAEQRSLNYFLLKNDNFNVVQNDTDLKQFYENNKDKYKIKEKILIDYLLFDIENFKNIKAINEDQVKDYYENNINLYSKKENRDLQFARFSELSEAKEFSIKLNEQNDEQLQEYVNKNNIKLSTLPSYAGEMFSEKINDIISNLNLNQVTEPLKYDDVGYYVFKILKINKSKIIEFSEVRNEIINYLALEAAYQEYDDLINYADEMLINDFSFDEINKNLTNVEIIKSVDINDIYPLLGENHNKVDSPPIGYISEIIINENMAYIYTVKEKENEYIPIFDKIKEKIQHDFTEEAKLIELNLQVNKILNELKDNNLGTFNNYTATNNLKTYKAEMIDRSNKSFIADTVQNIFQTDKNKLLKIELENGEIGIGIITEISEPDIKKSKDLYDSVENNIISNFNQSIETIIGNEIINNTNYKIYRQNIDRLFM